MRETDTHIYFWGDFMSNFYPAVMKIGVHPDIDDVTFPTSEHAFMAFKAIHFGDWDRFRLICQAMTPKNAKALGKLVNGFTDVKWAPVRVGYMTVACMAKFKQNDHLRELLLSTGSKTLVEASPYDKIWGVGLGENNDLILDENNWQGQNLLGRVLMHVRRELYLS